MKHSRAGRGPSLTFVVDVDVYATLPPPLPAAPLEWTPLATHIDRVPRQEFMDQHIFVGTSSDFCNGRSAAGGVPQSDTCVKLAVQWARDNHHWLYTVRRGLPSNVIGLQVQLAKSLQMECTTIALSWTFRYCTPFMCSGVVEVEDMLLAAYCFCALLPLSLLQKLQTSLSSHLQAVRVMPPLPAARRLPLPNLEVSTGVSPLSHQLSAGTLDCKRVCRRSMSPTSILDCTVQPNSSPSVSACCLQHH